MRAGVVVIGAISTGGATRADAGAAAATEVATRDAAATSGTETGTVTVSVATTKVGLGSTAVRVTTDRLVFMGIVRVNSRARTADIGRSRRIGSLYVTAGVSDGWADADRLTGGGGGGGITGVGVEPGPVASTKGPLYDSVG